jgi:TonB family protein
VLITIDPTTGVVIDASMAQSTGSDLLDDVTLSTFRRWRFKPGATETKIRKPITYTMSGVSY